jgi:lactate permease
VIRLTLVPFLYYALLPGAIGYSVVWFAQRGVLNLGTLLAALIAVAAVGAIAALARRPRSDFEGRQP